MPSLVLLPGLDGTGLLFGPLLAALAPDVPPIVVSYPGEEPLTYPELLPIVLASLPSDRPFVLLGESFSGPLAVMAAATHPPGLAGLVLCASFIRNPHPYVPSRLATAVRPALLRLFPRFSQVKALLGGYSSPSLRALTHQALARVSPAVLAGRIREVLKVNAAQPLTGVTVPVLYIRAQSDFVVPAWNIAAAKRACPHLQVVVVPGPHMVLQASAVAAAAVLTNFLTASAT